MYYIQLEHAPLGQSNSTSTKEGKDQALVGVLQSFAIEYDTQAGQGRLPEGHGYLDSLKSQMVERMEDLMK